jgi:hypothetical protein
MSLDMFANMFSQRHGIDQSMAGSVINAIMGHVTQQRGIGNLFSGDSYDNYSDDDRIGGIQSLLSNLGGMHQAHPLVQIVQQNAGINDPLLATQYTQQGIDLLNEHAYNNPQGIHSLFGNFLGGGAGMGGGFGDGGGSGFGEILGGGGGGGNPMVDMFSQRHGIDQSVAGPIINAVLGHVTQQRGIGNLFSGDSYDNYSDDDRIGGIQSILSNLGGGGGGIHHTHPLVQQIQEQTGIQDPQEAAQYTQHAIALMNEHANNNPQGMHSLFSRFLGGGL